MQFWPGCFDKYCIIQTIHRRHVNEFTHHSARLPSPATVNYARNSSSASHVIGKYPSQVYLYVHRLNFGRRLLFVARDTSTTPKLEFKPGFNWIIVRIDIFNYVLKPYRSDSENRCSKPAPTMLHSEILWSITFEGIGSGVEEKNTNTTDRWVFRCRFVKYSRGSFGLHSPWNKSKPIKTRELGKHRWEEREGGKTSCTFIKLNPRVVLRLKPSRLTFSSYLINEFIAPFRICFFYDPLAILSHHRT